MITRMIQSFCTATALLSLTSLLADFPQPYTNIRETTYTPYYLENGYLVGNLINNVSASVFVDIGSNDGAAARYAAQYFPEITTYAINAWTSCDQTRKNQFQRFLSNVIQENNAEKIIPIRMSSWEAARGLNLLADVVHITTSNTLGADIQAWFTHLSPSGALCGQDWDDPAVETIVSQAANTLGKQVHSDGTFWYIQKGL